MGESASKHRILGVTNAEDRPRRQHIFIYDPVHRERVRPGTNLKLEFLSPITDDARFVLDVRRGESTERYTVQLAGTVPLPIGLASGTCELQLKAITPNRVWVSQWIEVTIDPQAAADAHETGRRIYCPAPWMQMNIGKANASPCCNFVRKFRNPYRDDAEGYDPWNSKTMQAVRAALVRGSTKYCHPACANLTTEAPENGWPARMHIAADTPERAANAEAAREAFLKGETIVANSAMRIKLTVNHFCNHACLFCSRDVRSSWKANDAIFAILRRHVSGISRLAMTGGEPLVFLDEVGDRLQELEAALRGVTVEITTNGSLIARSIDFLSAIDQLVMKVSLNAGTPETYAAVHRKGHFQQVIDGIRLLQKSRAGKHLYIRLKMVMMQQNKNDIRAYAAIAMDLGVNEVMFSLRRFTTVPT